jgi:hypothetical protein
MHSWDMLLVSGFLAFFFAGNLTSTSIRFIYWLVSTLLSGYCDDGEKEKNRTRIDCLIMSAIN